jgi:hypothetical protein
MIHDIGGLLGDAYPKAITPTNITSGFRVAGIFPFNPDVFGEDEFLPSKVTDRPPPADVNTDQASTSKVVSTPIPTCSDPTEEAVPGNITPEDIRPYPKASARKSTQKRKKGKTLILTDTPIKERLALEKAAKKEPVRKQKHLKAPNTVLSDSSESEDEEVFAKKLADEDSSSDELELPEVEPQENNLQSEIESGSYVLVKFAKKKLVSHFVGPVMETDGFTATVNFFKTIKGEKISFIKPECEDICEIDNKNVVVVLPPPNKI